MTLQGPLSLDGESEVTIRRFSHPPARVWRASRSPR